MGAIETLEPPKVTRTSDTSSRDVMEAAGHLVDFRDGLVGHLMWLAEQTSVLSAPDAAVVVQRLLLVFGRDESYRRAVQIVTLSTPCWGDFRERGAERLASVDLLRAVCRETATAVRDKVYGAACVCREAVAR
jgi:hypothetical protein